MSYYIYLDGSGNEIKREKKGRGKTKKGFKKGKGGNYYQCKDNNKPSLQYFLRGMSYRVKDVSRDGYIVKIRRPDVFHYSAVKEICYMSSPAKIEIDVQNNIIKVWDLDSRKEKPDLVLKDRLDIESVDK